MSNVEKWFSPRSNKEAVEEGVGFAPKFDANGLIPVVTVDAHTGEVLMQAYMNAEALARTIEIGEAVYYSRSRQELWHKGATSGHVQKVIQMLTDCDQDTILLRVEAQGAGCCHVGYRSCFYREVPVGEAAKAQTGLLAMTFTEAEKAYDPQAGYGKKSK